MSERSEGTGPPTAELDPAEAEVRELLESAGARPEVPAERLQRIRAAARAEWRAQPLRVDVPSWRARAVPLALAASVVLAVALAIWLGRAAEPGPSPRPEAVAKVELLRGEALRLAENERPGEGTPLAVGAPLAAGSVVESGAGARAGRVALRLAGGGSLRLDTGTRLRLVSRTSFALESGAVYIDSDDAGSHAPPVEIATALGVVREIGTRFQVRLAGGAGNGLEVHVRDGRIALDDGRAEHAVGAGEGIVVHRDGSAERREVGPHGPEWEWVLAAAPAPAIEERTLAVFLDWLGRETGWTIEFESPELAAEAAAVRLHGSLEGLDPAEAAEVVLSGAGLDHRRDGRVLRIFRASGD